MNDDEDDIRAILIEYKLLPYQRFCPGAPHGPPFTAIAKGNAAVSVGLMVILAAASSIVASMLLHVLLPLMSGERTAKSQCGQDIRHAASHPILAFVRRSCLRKGRGHARLGLSCYSVTRRGGDSLLGT